MSVARIALSRQFIALIDRPAAIDPCANSDLASLISLYLPLSGYFVGGLSGNPRSCVSVKFHIAHLYEIQGKHRLAKEHYEILLKNEDALPLHLKADIYRQLGMFISLLARIPSDFARLLLSEITDRNCRRD